MHRSFGVAEPLDKFGRLKKGEPQPAQYGKGRTRAIPALADLYRREELPPLSEPRPGELRMLEGSGVSAFTEGLKQAKRKPRGAPAIP